MKILIKNIEWGKQRQDLPSEIEFDTAKISLAAVSEADKGLIADRLAADFCEDICGFDYEVIDERDFYINHLTFQILTDREIPEVSGTRSAMQLLGETINGDFVGRVFAHKKHAVEAEVMGRLLYEFGSEPGFFDLDPEEAQTPSGDVVDLDELLRNCAALPTLEREASALVSIVRTLWSELNPEGRLNAWELLAPLRDEVEKTAHQKNHGG